MKIEKIAKMNIELEEEELQTLQKARVLLNQMADQVESFHGESRISQELYNIVEDIYSSSLTLEEETIAH